MSVSITELIRQATPEDNPSRKKTIQLTLDYYGCQLEYKRKTSQIAVPRASNRCQQSLERVSGLFFEK
jgi:hypothetical protein